MDRVNFIQHRGKKILHINFADCKPDEVLAVITKAKEVIKSQSEKSVLTLTDVTNTRFNDEVNAAMKEYVAHNKPYVVAAAVVGVTGLRQIIFNAVMKFSGRHLTAFNTLEQAKEWLAGR